METCHYSHGCWMHIAYFVLWFAVTAGLVTLTWNKVITVYLKVKQMQYWQALLLLVTLAALLCPCGGLRHGGHHGMNCWQHEKCCDHEMMGAEGKGDCPFHSGNSDDQAAAPQGKAKK